MAIPLSQLETWCNQGAVTTSSQIYASIKTCLNAEASKISTKDYEMYLQGSYANDTNIYGDSDVDIVVQLHSVWSRDLSSLNDNERQLYLATHETATYQWKDFYDDVFKTLCNYYEQTNIDNTGKVIKVNTGKSYRADVVVAIDYRKYLMFQDDKINRYIEGIKFHILKESNRSVINFPKWHYNNGVAKNRQERTGGRYKLTVRMFKNIRNKLIENEQLSNKSVPSYFLECLLYNVPDDCYSFDCSQTFCDIVNYLHKADLQKFLCQNEQAELFGDSHEQWELPLANSFISELIKLWNSW
jgi:hypothetical protein